MPGRPEKWLEVLQQARKSSEHVMTALIFPGGQ